MRKDLNESLWTTRRAGKISNLDRFILKILVFAGVLGIVILANWWFRSEHIDNLLLYILLSLATWWLILRLLLEWIGLLRLNQPDEIPVPQDNLKVAIFTTSSPGEPLEMFERTLSACQQIAYPHQTYLLDDTEDPAFKAMAEKYNAKWLNLVGLPGAKAGKINEALKMTSEEFILVLDPDHVPFPEFLNETLGFFNDEKVGFVQVSQAYYNQFRSFTAEGAAEQTYTFYGPSQMSMHGVGCAVAIGANCTFRRMALESIGGHGIGLAEDLVTSIRLHAAGWKSIYNPVIVSRGLVPEDFGSFAKQQLKWSRGLFEVAFAELPQLWKKLSSWQKLTYSMISTYYFNGLTTFIFIAIPIIFLAFGTAPAKMEIIEFINHIFVLLLIDLLIYIYIQKWLCHPKVERGFHLKGMVLKFCCAFVFLYGFLLAIFNQKIPYIPTAKKANTGNLTKSIRPLMFYILIVLIAVSATLYYRATAMTPYEIILTYERTWGMIFFASIPFILSIWGLYAAFNSKELSKSDPWDHVPTKISNPIQESL